jgi:hypothetical protein
MTNAEREYAVAYLERTKSALMDAVGSLGEAQWFFKPGPEEWSAAECVEHLSITEGQLLRTIRKAASGPPSPEEVLKACAGREAVIEKKVPRRGFKAKAPEGARPGACTNPAEVVARFVATRDATIEYARSTTDGIRERTFPHFVFGPLDGYQWLIFMAAHTERHLAQLQEAVAASGVGD